MSKKCKAIAIIESILSNQQNIDAMEIASMNGMAAVSPIAPMIEGILNPLTLRERNYLKQLTGKKIFKILIPRGFVHDKYGVAVTTSELFSVGSRYKKNTEYEEVR